MTNSNFAFIPLNGKRYGLDLFNPLEAIAFGSRALALFGPILSRAAESLNIVSRGANLADISLLEAARLITAPVFSQGQAMGGLDSAELAALLQEALSRCRTPQNESLNDTATLNRWFQENSNDLYPLAGLALFRLIKDFFPRRLVTGASVSQARNEPTPDPAFKSRLDGKHMHTRAC